jgi:predicted ferric reductase
VSSRSSTRGLLTAIVIGALATVALSLVGVPPGPVRLDAGLVAHVAGLLAGYAAPVMVILMSRVPRLERRVGSDVLARWHGRGGRLFVVLMLVHAAAAVQAWASTRGQNVVVALISVLGLPWLGAATVATGLFLAIAAISVGAARRAVSFETWQAVHLLTYIAIVLAFLHELAGPNLAGHPALQVVWTLLHAYALALVLLTHSPWSFASGCWHRWRTPGVTASASQPSSRRPTGSSA